MLNAVINIPLKVLLDFAYMKEYRVALIGFENNKQGVILWLSKFAILDGRHLK